MLGRKAAGVAGSRSTPAGAAAEAATGIENQGVAGAEGERGLLMAALYARVSTDKQERNETIASQLDALQRAAAEGGYVVAPGNVFVDAHHSGARLDRPALDRLRDHAAEGVFEVVLAYSPDRLARQYAHQVLVIEELQRAGCRVVFLNHAFGESPEQRMLLQIQGVFAEYERALIKDRMRRGRLFAARQGRMTWGNPPYGYRYRPKADDTPQQLVVDEAEAETVRLMYGWLIEEGCSSYAIEKRLVTQGVPARAPNHTGWRQSSVIGILRNPLYKGEAYYNRTMAVDAKRPHKSKGLKDYRPGNLRGRAERPREEWISVRVPAIVDPETWELAQAQLARNRDRATRYNTRRAYLLRSLLVCGCCGRRMVGMWRNGSGQYVCSARYPPHQPWACHGRSVRDRKVEPLIWDYVQELLSDPELLQERYREGQGDPAIGQRDEHERDRLARKIAALDREVERLIDAYQAEVIDLTELKQRRVRIEEHGQVLRARLAELVNQRAEREQEIRVLEGLQAFSASVRDGLHDPSFAVKQRVWQLVVDRIVVEDSRVVVHHVVPSGPVRLQTGQFSGELLQRIR